MYDTNFVEQFNSYKKMQQKYNINVFIYKIAYFNL